MQDRSSIRHMAADAAQRRVRKAPTPHTLAKPPPLYPEWRHRGLKKAAREVIRDDWPSVKQRMAMLCESTQLVAKAAAVKAQGREERVEESEHDVRTQMGGLIGDGDDAYQLPAGSALTIAMFDKIPWSKAAKRKWTLKAIANQMKLRNLPSAVGRRSERLSAEYERRKLFGVGTKLRVSAANAEQLVALLRQVLEAEEVAAAADAAATKAVAAAELASAARARRGRRGRGQNERNREAPQ